MLKASEIKNKITQKKNEEMCCFPFCVICDLTSWSLTSSFYLLIPFYYCSVWVSVLCKQRILILNMGSKPFCYPILTLQWRTRYIYMYISDCVLTGYTHLCQKKSNIILKIAAFLDCDGIKLLLISKKLH